MLSAQALWPQLKGLKCIHSASAGLEGLLFPELVDSPVLVTNAKVRAGVSLPMHQPLPGASLSQSYLRSRRHLGLQA